MGGACCLPIVRCVQCITLLTVHSVSMLLDLPSLSVAYALQEFDAFLQDVATNQEYNPKQRLQLLEEWEKGPSARACQPREEHLLPLHVIAGAAQGAAGHVTFDDELMGVKVSSFMFN